MDMLKRSVPHPNFRYCQAGAKPLVFIFDRPLHKPATPEQLAEYHQNRIIVEQHGGLMATPEYAIGGPNPPFNEADVQEMINAVLASNPDVELLETWNGVDCYTLSVGCRVRANAPEPTR